MKILKSNRKENTVSLKIEVSEEEFNDAMNKAFKSVSKHAKIKGFRKGKITRNIFEKHYGKDILIQEATSNAVNDTYTKAIQEESLNVVDYPANIDISKYEEGKNITYTCDVTVAPIPKLGKYKGLKVKKEVEIIDEDKINQEIDKEREKYVDYPISEGAAEKDSILRLNITATIDNEPYEQWTKENVSIKLGLGSYSEQFDTEITGLKINDEKSFEIKYDKDFVNSEVQDKTVAFKIKVNEIRERKLPELDEELVKKISDKDSVESYKAHLQETLTKQAATQAEEKVKNDLIEQAIENMKIDIPEVLITRETDYYIKDIENRIKQSGLTLEQYCEFSKTSIDEMKEKYKDEAVKKIKTDFCLKEIAEEEKIEITDETVKEDIKSWGNEELQSDEQVESYLKKIDINNLKHIIKMKKTIDFLVDNAKIK